MVESGGKTVINEPDAARVEPASQGCWAAMIINGDVAEMIDFAIENDAVELLKSAFMTMTTGLGRSSGVSSTTLPRLDYVGS